MNRISLAFSSFFSILFKGALPPGVAQAFGYSKAIPVKAAQTPKPQASAADGAVQILGILQRDARLVDFLMEDIASYTDDQVGAAMRRVHENSRQVLLRHLKLSPVIDGVEGTYTKLISIDTSAVRVLGKAPPNQTVEGGTLRHRGWRAQSVSLPPIGRGENMNILAPAEIEVE